MEVIQSSDQKFIEFLKTSIDNHECNRRSHEGEIFYKNEKIKKLELDIEILKKDIIEANERLENAVFYKEKLSEILGNRLAEQLGIN